MLPGETVLTGSPSHEEDPNVSEFKVMCSGAGWYIGTTIADPECGGCHVPNTRETRYFRTESEAAAELRIYEQYGVLMNQR